MFKKFTAPENLEEKLEIFNLLKFNLVSSLKLMELLALLILGAGLGWRISSFFTNMLGPFYGTPIAVAALLLFVLLLRLPPVFILTKLYGDFGLDLRPSGPRLKKMASLSFYHFLLAWVASLLLLAGLHFMPLWIWTVASLAASFFILMLASNYPGLADLAEFRQLRPGDLPDYTLVQLDQWSGKTGVGSKDILISTTFNPVLEAPSLFGLGRKTRLIVPERALAVLPPKEMNFLVLTAAIGGVANAQLKFIFLRFCALATAFPLAAILIATWGSSMWGYPLMINPSLVVYAWLGLWLGVNLAEISERFTRRSIEVQLAAAVSTILVDQDIPQSAYAALGSKNLAESSPPLWRAVFLKRHGVSEMLKRIRYQCHLAKFED